MKYKRIYILGSSGSGKSYLANILSRNYKIPHYELDEVYWEKKYTVKRTEKEREKILKKISNKKSWIMEGVYGDWIGTAFKKSDLVIILDFPRSVLMKRVFQRYWKKRKKENVKLRTTFVLMKMTYKYRKNPRGLKKHLELVEKYNSNCIIIRNKRELELFLKEIK